VGCHLLISAGRLQNDLIWAPSWWALSINYPRNQADLARRPRPAIITSASSIPER